MFTLGVLCLFLGFIIAIVFMIALAARRGGEDNENEGNARDEERTDDGGEK